MRVIVYTCTFFDYDQVMSPMARTAGVDYVLISDRAPRLTPGWSWRPLPPEAAGESQTMANRWCKFFPHRLFPDADVTIYVDGNTLVIGDLTPLIAEFRASGAVMGVFRHQKRGSIAEERRFCLEVGKLPADQADAAAAQAAFYAEDAPGPDDALYENGVLLRRGDAAALEPAMALWWAQMLRWPRRDQLSLPYVLRKTGLPHMVLPWDYKADNPYFFRFARHFDLGQRLLVRLEAQYRFGRHAYLARKTHALLRAAMRLGGRRVDDASA